MGNLFFTSKREHFFRPLSRSDRECCAAVLRALYHRIHGPNANYSEALTREIVLGVTYEVLTSPDIRGSAFERDKETSAEAERAYAGELLRALKEHGWLEDYRDPIDLRPTLKMTRAGKEFAEVFSNLDNSRTKTRQRNMRSTRKALGAFLVTRDVDELLDAYEFAMRVVQDLQEDIEYFRTLMQSLTREALEQKIAWSEFNEFIESRFQREYAVRLVADSAERHRGHLLEQLEQVRALPDEMRVACDVGLLQRAAWLEQEAAGRSPLLWLCDRVDSMVDAACNLKLPMLRSEMSNYVRRFTSLLRQALSLDYSAESPLGRSMALLKERPEDERVQFLEAMGSRMGTAEVRLPGAGVRWTVKERAADDADQTPLVVTWEARIEAAMRRAEAEAFAVSDRDVLTKLLSHLKADGVKLNELPITNAMDVLVALHAVGASRSSDARDLLHVRKLEDKFETPYFVADNYQLVPRRGEEPAESGET
jgi:hypothetical protein